MKRSTIECILHVMALVYPANYCPEVRVSSSSKGFTVLVFLNTSPDMDFGKPDMVLEGISETLEGAMSVVLEKLEAELLSQRASATSKLDQALDAVHGASVRIRRKNKKDKEGQEP